ncbi:MAG: VOC family protein [Spirochaetes bacterium]|jgi:lactoylglutathione lyase|nr:VOC family protein [Spirochaetota bacterium]
MKSKITHIAIYVTNLNVAKEFYTSFFDGKSNELYQNNSGFSSYFIRFDGEVSIELMHHKELEERAVIEKITGYSHVAFSVGSRQAVIELTDKIVDAGYELYSAPRETGDGYFESCVADPDGNRVEITV